MSLLDLIGFKGTPGDWFIVEDNSITDDNGNGPTYFAVSKYEDDTADAICWVGDGSDNEETRANANLLASSKELLELAVDIMTNYDCDTDAHKYGTRCRKCAAATIVNKILNRSGGLMKLSDILADDVTSYLISMCTKLNVDRKELKSALAHVLNKRLINDLPDVVDLSGLPEDWSVSELKQNIEPHRLFKYTCCVVNRKLNKSYTTHSSHAQAAFDTCVRWVHEHE